MNPKFKKGDLAKYTSGNLIHGSSMFVNVPILVYDYNDHLAVYGIQFFRNAANGVRARTVYSAEPEQLTPCTQEELDNWILEQELTS